MNEEELEIQDTEFNCERFITSHPIFNHYLLEMVNIQNAKHLEKTDAPTSMPEGIDEKNK